MEWICPYCGHTQTVTNQKIHSELVKFNVESKKLSNLALRINAIGCSNSKCGQIEVKAILGNDIRKNMYGNISYDFNKIKNYSLRPSSCAKPQPDCIPKPIHQDYEEACEIAELSPKASATLARRCIQGMIRDFCGVSGNTLYAEIDNLKKLDEEEKLPKGVTPESIEAIDQIRQIGNIGAHMEKDINIIIDVEPDEADALIGLVEMLFEEWYIARENRKQRLAKVTAIATKKKEAKTDTETSKVVAKAATPTND